MNYTIIGVADQVRDWIHTASGSQMRAYRIDLQSPDGVVPLVEWSRKASSPPPEQGQVVEGEVESGKYGQKFHKAAGGGFGSRPEDPQRQKRIVRQHSQNMAIQTIELARSMEIIEIASTTDLFALIAKTADWFDKDVESAAS